MVPEGLSLHYARVRTPSDEPRPEPGVVDVAVLDMHHGLPNLGHASIVESLLNYAHDERVRREGRAPGVRVLSYDVRRGKALPSDPGRFPILVGTGGPGAIDPRENDGVSPHAQGVLEDPGWEAPLFGLLDEILAREDVALLGICHSFGILGRWSGAARAVLRPAEKGGKSAGIVPNVLTEEALAHPFFGGWADENGSREVKVLDSRLYDLLPTGRGSARTLSLEGGAGGAGDAITMFELARTRGSAVPRVWGVNHHPEIGDVGLQRERLHRMRDNGGVTREWFEERLRALDGWKESAATERGLQRTSAWTFERPLRAHLSRIFG